MTDTAGTNPFLADALSYARAGWLVVPLEPSGDKPLATTPSVDAHQLASWWNQWPLANVGVSLGIPPNASVGICALVADCTDAANTYLKRHEIVEKIGAGHVLSKPERVWIFATQRPIASRELATGVRLIGDGVLVMPPSQIADREYRWRKGQHFADRPVSIVPRWLLLAATDNAPPDPDRPAISVSDDWTRDLRPNPRGGYLPTFGNICTILRCAPAFSGRLAYDQMRLTPTLDGTVLSDERIGAIRERVERDFDFSPADGNLRQALLTVACEKSFHPVQSYLKSLKWDGLARIERVASEVLGIVNPDPLTQRMIRAWFVSAVARGMEAGSKVDTALVLVGPQGARKSTFFRVLGGAHFSDTHMDITNKDSLLQIANAWIYEWAEIENVTSRKQASEVKMFVTSQVDSFRPPFEKSVRQVPRTAVIVGTTNKDRFLSDESGSRRFWIIRIIGRIDIEKLTSWRDQLWAEAVSAFAQREVWYLSDEDDAAREAAADEFHEEDPWELAITHYLRSNIRADYTANEVMASALKLDISDMDATRTVHRVARILHRLGLKREKRRILRDGKRLPPLWCWCMPDVQPPWILKSDMPGMTANEEEQHA